MGEKDKLTLGLPLGELIDSGVSFIKKDRLKHESMRSLHMYVLPICHSAK